MFFINYDKGEINVLQKTNVYKCMYIMYINSAENAYNAKMKLSVNTFLFILCGGPVNNTPKVDLFVIISSSIQSLIFDIF